jgi:hypothetical protein
MRLNAGDGSYVNRLAMKIDSSQEVENYAWLGMVPKMREWIGGRQPKGLRENTWSITNKDYEATLEILTKDMRRDKFGQIKVRIAELARRALTFPASLMTTLIINGERPPAMTASISSTPTTRRRLGSQNNDLTRRRPAPRRPCRKCATPSARRSRPSLASRMTRASR